MDPKNDTTISHPLDLGLTNVIRSIMPTSLVSVHAFLDDCQCNYVIVWYEYSYFDHPIFTSYSNYSKLTEILKGLL